MRNFYQQQERERERTLARLERKYDKATDYVREYYADKQAIEALVRSKKIDAGHGQLLLAEAKDRYETEHKRRRTKATDERREARDQRLTGKVHLWLILLMAAFFIWLRL